MKPTTYISALLVALLLSCVESASGQLVLSAQDTRANTTTAKDQNRPAAAQASNGQALFVWESTGQDGDGYGIYGQRFNSAGAAQGAEFAINSTSDAEQRMPDVAMDDAGNYAVAWMDSKQDGDAWGVYFQLYDSVGGTVNGNSRANDSTAGNQKLPSISMDAAGNFTIVWMSESMDGDDYGIAARRYSSYGVALASEFQVNDSSAGYQGHPDVAMDSAGNFVVVWQSEDYDGDGNGIFAKIFDNSGAVLANEFQVNTSSSGNQQEPSVGMDENGDMVISWSSFDGSNDVYQVKARRFDLSGNALSGEFLVSGTSGYSHDHSDVAVTREGTFAVSWSSYGTDGDAHGIYMQAYDSAGVANGGEVLVNSTTSAFQHLGGTAWHSESLDLLMAWQSGDRHSSSTQDGDGYGIYFKAGTLGDTEAPVAVCQDVTTYLDASGAASIVAADVDGGSSDNIGVDSASIDVSSFDCTNLGINAVLLTVVDAAGNSSTCSGNVTVVDNTAPTAVCAALTISLDASGAASISASQLDGGSSDNCGVASTSASQTSFSCSDLGSSSVTLTVTDGSGNTGNCTATVTVEDNIAPTAICQNTTVQLDGTGNATITDADVDGGSSDNCNFSIALSQSSFDCSELGSNSVTVIVADGAGNSANCVANVTVEDATAPTAVCQDLTVQLDGSGSANISASNVDGGSSDNCSVSLSLDNGSFSCSNIGQNSVTLTASDGNSSSNCQAVVTVEDATAPVVTCQNTTVSLGSGGSASITAADVTGSVSDNCSVASTSINTSNFGCTNIGANSVTLTATDGSGNSSSCNATVTVQDNVAPVAACKNVTVNLDAMGLAFITTSSVNNGSSDNCSVSLSVSDNSFNCNDVGNNSVTLTATDAAGNSDNCTAVVTVEDVTAPTLTCPGTATYDCISEIPDPNMSQVAVFDNCSGTAVSVNDDFSITASECGSGWHKRDRIFTAVDANGNVSSCSWRIKVAIVTYKQGTNSFCFEKVKVTPNCMNASCAYVTSTGSLNKVTLRDQNNVNYTINNPGGKSGTFCHPSGLPLKKVWVKSGCYSGNNNKGYAFPLCNGTSKTGGEEIVIDFDPGLAGGLRLEAWPNPTDGALKVELNAEVSAAGSVDVQVVDMMGKVLDSRQVDLQGGHSEMDFDLSPYSVGMYYIVVDGFGDRLTKKIVKR